MPGLGLRYVAIGYGNPQGQEAGLLIQVTARRAQSEHKIEINNHRYAIRVSALATKSCAYVTLPENEMSANKRKRLLRHLIQPLPRTKINFTELKTLP